MTTRSEIVESLAKQFPQLEQKDNRIAVDTILAAMATALSKGERIELRRNR
jgi:integration host factor subunit beta